MKTNTDYSRERRERLRSQGLKEVRNLWTKPEFEKAIRKYAEKLNKPTPTN